MKLNASKVWGSVACVAALATGCGGSAGVDEPSEETGSVNQAFTTCNLGFSYNGGTWERKAFDASCASSFPTTQFSFGVSTDVPLLFHPSGCSQGVATYGTTNSPGDDRMGRFFIDQDCSHAWDHSDTNTKFMATPQSGDQPVILYMTPLVKSGNSCVSSGFFTTVVGIKRGQSWYIDANTNGTWDGSSGCDVFVSNFGDAADIPVPTGGMIGTTRNVGSVRHWFLDTDGSNTWNGAPPDTDGTNFGLTTWRPFSDYNQFHIGVQNGRDVYLNTDGNYNWVTGTDIALPSFVSSTSWKFVGWIQVVTGG